MRRPLAQSWVRGDGGPPGTGLAASLVARLVLAALLFVAIMGCARHAGPPPIAGGVECARCSMETSSRHFACEREVSGKWLVYDALECLARDAGREDPTAIWLPDYDEGALHRADSLWLVHGDLATPMGGGLVAFMSRAAADTIAASSHGVVGRWREIAPAMARP
jgi:hypothetical protein